MFVRPAVSADGHVTNTVFGFYLHDVRVAAAISRQGGSAQKAAEDAVASAKGGGISSSGVAAALSAGSPIAGLSLSLAPITALAFDYSAPLYPGKRYGVELSEENESQPGFLIVVDEESGSIAFRAKFRTTK